MGTFTVLPSERRVHYQRSHSAFAMQPIDAFQWRQIYTYTGNTGGKGGNGSGRVGWIHATGISPLCSDTAAHNWSQHLIEAHALSIPVSVDFNWRPALGSLEKLWSLVLPRLRGPSSGHADVSVNVTRVLVLSLTSLRGIAKLLGLQVPDYTLP